MIGTAKRTENPIIDDTPGPVDKSTLVIARTMKSDMGIEMSQNSFHPLMALFFSTACKSILMFSNHLGENELVLATVSFRPDACVAPDRSRVRRLPFVIGFEDASKFENAYTSLARSRHCLRPMGHFNVPALLAGVWRNLDYRNRTSWKDFRCDTDWRHGLVVSDAVAHHEAQSETIDIFAQLICSLTALSAASIAPCTYA